MTLLEITRVEQAGPDKRLVGWSIDRPAVGTWAEALALDVAGWALGTDTPVVAIELIAVGPLQDAGSQSATVLQRVPLRARADVAAFFPTEPHAARSGFQTTVELRGPARAFALSIRAVLADRSRVPLATIQAERRWRQPDDGAGGELVSVVIPCYNQAHFLPDAIQSVLAQSHPHVEVVVVDDGSDDNTAQVAARFPGVRCVRQPNQGLAAARNTGLRESQGSYLVFLDADDRLLPDALAAGLACLRAHPACAFAAGHYRLIAADGSPLPTEAPRRVRDDPYLRLLQRNFISPPAVVLYRRAVFEVARGFNTSLSPTADYDLYLRIAREYPICRHDTVTAEYRQHGMNMTRNPELMLRTVQRVLRSQRPYVRKSEPHRRALAQGWRFTQRAFGEALADQTTAALLAGDLRRASRLLLALIRYYPRGFRSALKSWLVCGPRETAGRGGLRTLEVVSVEPAGPDERLLASGLDQPKPGSRAAELAVDVAGWVLGRRTPVVAAEVVEGATVLERVALLPRPDVAAAFPGQPGAEQSGFRATVSARGPARDLILGVCAVLADQSRVPLGTIRARRVR